RWPAGARSVTGTTRSGGRSSPVSAPPAPVCRSTPDVPAPGLPRAGRLAALGARRPAARPVPAGLGATPAAPRDGERGWVRRRLVRTGRPGPGQVPARDTDLGR